MRLFTNPLRLSIFFLIASLLSNAFVLADTNQAKSNSKPIRLLLLGDKGHHRPSDFAGRIVPRLATVGIEVEYTEDISLLEKFKSDATSALNAFDCLMIYANIEKISPEQEQGLLAFVESGKGFIPVHCASFCFLNSDRYVQLVGAQFKEHGSERFSTQITAPEHEIMKGFSGFESWDETYTHHRHNPVDRTVIESRVEGPHPQGVTSEPWSWTRTQGKGRIFYTAWGHDERTWNQPGFHNLLERGIRWAANASLNSVKAFADPDRFPEPQMTKVPTDLPAFTYTDVGAQIPNYTPSKKWGVQGDPLTSMQNPLSSEESRKHFVTPEGFQVKRWASEADETLEVKTSLANGQGLVGKPIAMNWDERGRLWICETIDYPNELQPLGAGRDTIRICEDTNGDNVADKFTLFASGLSIPSTLVCFRGGAIVQDGKTTLYLKDIDGDDKADFRQELITGWVLGDTHGGVSNFQYGIDNWIYAMQGYNDSKPIINGVQQQGFRQGFWRFAVEPGKSDSTAPAFDLTSKTSEAVTKFDTHTIRVAKLEFLRATDNNTWGLGLSEEGLVFGSTANGNPSDFMPIANSYYERVKGWSPETLHMISDNDRFAPITASVRQVDHHGGYTAGAGHALYTARKYPRSWWNRTAFVCEPTGHLVGAFVLSRDGAGYRSTSPFNLLASNDEWAAPIMAEVGPDGNVWVLDWYNYIIQHNPTPHGFQSGRGNAYESKLRDKKYGRVYRVEYAGGESNEKAKSTKVDDETIAKSGLAKADALKLVAGLKHSNLLWRKTAQRLLIEKYRTASESELAKIENGLLLLVRDQSKDEIGLNVAAIHALWTLDGLGRAGQTVRSAQFAALKHPSAGVRRTAILVLDSSEATVDRIVESGLLQDTDAQVKLAAILKIADTQKISDEAVNRLIAVEQLDSDKILLDAWTSATSIHANQVLPKLLSGAGEAQLARTTIMAEHFARSAPTAEAVSTIIKGGNNPAVQAAILVGLEKGWAKNYLLQLDDSSQKILVSSWLENSLPIDSKSRLLQLAIAFGVKDIQSAAKSILGQLLAGVRDSKLSTSNRLLAATQLVSLQNDNDEIVTDLLDLITPQSSPEMSQGIIQSLRSSRAPKLADSLLSKSTSFTPELRASVVRLLLSRPETTRRLLEGITGGQVALSELQLDQRQALREHPDAEVRALAMETMKASGGVPNADRQKVLDAWMNVTTMTGSLASGKAMFQKHCALCHIHGSIGAQIGPNLTGMAVHPKAELLMNILDPSRSVEGNFRTYSVLTTDGVVLTGMMAGESKTSIELINTQGKREPVLREDIDQLTASTKSLMPEGFESQMTREEMSDLLEFLTSKGKYVPISIDNVATASSGRGLFTNADSSYERMVFKDWQPKMIGELPFLVVDPEEGRKANIIILRGPAGTLTEKLPAQVDIVCNARAAAIHLLSGVGGWNYPISKTESTSMIVRLQYNDGATEDHAMVNGVHMADYISKVDVPSSTYAFSLNDGHQIRTIKLVPKRDVPLSGIQLIKGEDGTSPIVMAITIESP